MSLAVLLLRLFLALLLAGHASQKLFGWFRGRGIRGTATIFESSGLRPGPLMVLAAGLTELTAAVLFVLGFATPLASAMTLGAMMVAGATLFEHGLWAHLGGYEVPLAYAAIAFVIAVTGPGSFSLDALIGVDAISGILVALGALVLAGLFCSPLVVMVARHSRLRERS